MATRYIGELPRPEGQQHPQIYRWAKLVTRWFENWVSAGATASVVYAPVLNTYQILTSWQDKGAFGGTLAISILRNGEPLTERGTYRLVFHGGNPTSLFYVADGAEIYNNDGGDANQLIWRKNTTDKNCTTVSINQIAAAWSVDTWIMAPYGLAVNTTLVHT